MKILLSYYILILTSINSFSQSFDIYNNIFLKDYSYKLIETLDHHSFYNYPKTVKLDNSINNLLDPIIQLNSSEKLKLAFDILSSEYSSYAYTFIHCDSKWNYSDMSQAEYLDGFFHNYIETYSYSFNTIPDYIYYECEFPNENINFKKSGNYIVLVYNTENNKPIITKRFMVNENLVKIDSEIQLSSLPRERDTNQEINLYITNIEKLNIQDPNNELKIIIQKNDNWNDIIIAPKPSFYNNQKIEYNQQNFISFPGGSEYRDFDIKSLRYYGKNILNIENKLIQGNTIYLVTLYQDIIENSENYKFKYDLNGKYVTSVSENKNKNTEGNYALVKFTLQKPKLNNKDIYIYGELTNWDILPEAKMIFDDINNNYYGLLYLKQGYYNYEYISLDMNNEITFLKNNHKETRNKYSNYVYYRPRSSHYDRLVGVNKNTSNGLN